MGSSFSSLLSELVSMLMALLPPVERKKKNAKTSPAKINQQPTFIPETKIKNRFSVLSDLVLKPKTQTETSSSSSSVSSNSASSSSYSPVKAQATKKITKLGKKT